MKGLSGLIAVLSFAAAMRAGAISIDAITVTGASSASGPVVVNATISGASAQGASATFTATTTNGLSRRNFYPTPVSGTSWTSGGSWNPYFTGTFVVELIAWDNNHMSPPVMASATVTVTRTVSGTINSIKYLAPMPTLGAPYNPGGNWVPVDLMRVKLHDIGMNQDSLGVGSVGCNLLNVTNLSGQLTPEQEDIAYTDTAAYMPAGTHYRFNLNFHARPHGFMGMGEVKRWVWMPTDTNNPGGPGQLELDITSCSPWRSDYTTNLQSHVGFAPLFAEGEGIMPDGNIMCTTAHYMDVSPTNADGAAAMAGQAANESRAGLYVRGHTGTRSYLKMFLSDAMLRQHGISNVYDATNVLAGFVQHFDTNNIPLDSPAQVTASFLRIEGGTNLLYDFEGDGVGESGYEIRFDFDFHSAVAAMMGMAQGEVAGAAMPVAADFDGDSKADAAIFNTNGTWKLKLSSGNYSPVTLSGFLGGEGATAYAADFDGDAKADPGVYYESLALWTVKLSSIGYLAPTVLTDFGGAGWQAVAADFDGDRFADPALYNTNGNWQVKLSTAGYQTIPLSGLLGFAGWTAIAADLDGDGKADPTIYQAASGSWIVLLSRSNYALALLDPGFLGAAGYAGLAADFDADGFADPAAAQAFTGNWKLKLSSSSYGLVDLPAFLGQ